MMALILLSNRGQIPKAPNTNPNAAPALAQVPIAEPLLSSACSGGDSTADWRPVRNGYEPRQHFVRGTGRLTIENGTASDAVVKLDDRTTGSTARKIVVAASHTATINNIASARFGVQYEVGSTYLRKSGRFCHPDGVFEFEETLDFTDSEHVVSYTLTLHQVIGGNARAHPVGRAFPIEPDDTVP